MNDYSPIRQAGSYALRGFSPIPICRPCSITGTKGKEPGYFSPKNGCQIRLTGWDRFCLAPANAGEQARWIEADPQAGLGLACGYDGLFPLDVDDSRAVGAVREVVGHLKAPSKIGAKGATGFFYDPTGLLESFVFRAKLDETGARNNLVEGLGVGRQTVIPHSMHWGANRPYRWHNASLEDLTPSDLPVLTAQMIADIRAGLAPHMEEERDVVHRVNDGRNATINDFERKRYQGFAQKALDAEVARIASQPKPGRNRELFRAVCNVGKFATNGIIPSKTISDRMIEACERNKLEADNGVRDIMKTIQAGFNYARNDPLPRLPERPR
jgi:hypothetical protein